jgi:pimeloyl-ACP methyl ester carboxylesterase
MVDLPGHGLSDTFSECHSMEFMAGIVSELLNHLDTGRVMLAGHSLGGYVAMAFLELFPEKLAGYSLFHSHPFADTEAAIEKRHREIAVVKAGKKNLMYPGNIEKMYSPENLLRMSDSVAWSNDIASLTPDEGIVSVLYGMISRPSRQSLFEKGVVPLLWVLGIHDQYIDYKTVSAAVEMPHNGVLKTLFHSGHLGFIEEPERSCSILEEFAFTVFSENSRA